MRESVGARKRVTLERTFEARLEDVWELWTTREGIESWWGPEGFRVEVRALDLRPGGYLDYAMTATEADQIDFLKKAGMPISTEHRNTFTEVDAQRRLVYTSSVDFVPGVSPYEVTTSVELEEKDGGVRLLLTLDAMHDAHWTGLMKAGWESELGKLGGVLAAR
ncbi:MAG: SRPBCC domain-containing protein [Chloroflexota bacterium]